MVQARKTFRGILVDPDPAYAEKFISAAAIFGLVVDHFRSMQDIVYLGIFNNYDVAILNTEIGQVSGWEIAEYIEKFGFGLPVVLLSDHLSQIPENPEISASKHLLKGVGSVTDLVEEIAQFLTMKLTPASTVFTSDEA